MNITIKATRHGLSDAEREMAEAKLGSLTKHLGTGVSAETAELNVELAVVADGEKHGTAFRAEANLNVAGHLHRAEALAGTMAAAVDRVREELAQELQKGRGRRRTLIRRGGAALKSMLRRDRGV
jgi:ribosomal subunit interface protein